MFDPIKSLIIQSLVVILVESKYESSENYDGNDGFSPPQIENKTRKDTLFF